MSELDPKKTYLYAKYEAAHTQMENNIQSLCHIIHALITTKAIHEERAKRATKSQVAVLIESLIEISESSLEVMEVIRAENERNPIYDEQILRELKDVVAKLKYNKLVHRVHIFAVAFGISH
ncbi:hypothetical protein LZP73_14745 [Shewanella sp. AS16]|uniref:hypothetical protein n=1 Tax=Shewanella sp. AS16 TaxID=2907625 RepID=UPI001F3B77E5|nr:hypothetical protein [Shewanella sp. AS16]MCE9687445.1 hypothetical protein [Shewanella sp. AS16]